MTLRPHFTTSWLAAALTSLLGACGPAAGSAQGSAPESGPLTQAKPGAPTAPNTEPPEPRARCTPASIEVPPPRSGPLEPPLPAIERPELLAPFFDQVLAHLRGELKRPVRIGFYGDSNLTLDFLSGELRRVLQKIYGDGGHGYVAVGRPWRWYQHIDVSHDAFGNWRLYCPTTLREPKHVYGSAGIAAATRSPGAYARYATAPEGSPVGTQMSRFGVYYLGREKPSEFAIVADGKEIERVTAEGPSEVRLAEVSLPDGPHRVDVVAKSTRELKLFGVVMERERGIVVDSLGIGGVGYYALAELEPKTAEQMLRSRSYDLVIFLLGTNLFRAGDNPKALKQILEVHRRANPRVAVLVMSPPDQVANAGASQSRPAIVKVSRALAAAAAEEQVAFWDFREAMGGEASMARFSRHGLAGGDLYHFTEKGAAFMGSRIAHVLSRELEAYAGTRCDSKRE